MTLYREQAFFGPGPAQLLQGIERTASVALASEETGISYSKCWQMIRRLEKKAGFAVLERKTGGSGGGGSRLTQKGRDLLRRYERLGARMKEALQTMYEEEFGDFLFEEGSDGK